MMNRKKRLQSLFFLGLGLLLFAYLYRGIQWADIKEVANELNYYWIGVSLAFGLFSHFIIALRWRMLIRPLGHTPRLHNLFLAALILSFTNILIPRGGEVARCLAVTKYENISFARVFGTVVTERFTDFIVLVTIFLFILLFQLPLFRSLVEQTEQVDLDFTLSDITHRIILYVVGAFLLVMAIYLISRIRFRKGIRQRIQRIKKEFFEGFRSIIKLNNKGLYLLYSVSIYLVWLGMSYVVFFAYEPTSHLGVSAAIFTFAVSTFAFILPIQAGMGAWHFMVSQSLLIFGISQESGVMFALIAHTFTNLIYLIVGLLALVALPFLNGQRVFGPAKQPVR